MNNMENILNLVSPIEALNRGNLFDNLFWPYKYVANLKPKNDREKLLQMVQAYCFAAHELNLYLDLYPNDTSAIGIYNQYKEIADKYTNEYEMKYGPLTTIVNEKNTWQWINSPWPWEKI